MPTIRRTLKNVVKNYSDAQVKVREATSNDPWGPSSTLMGEVADLTYNVVAFTEIMQMIWKRLNDDGKNWRHVYKAMVLLDYIVKTGSEKVAQQCKENFHAIKTLSSFQYIDADNKDQGMNVREKAKQLVALLSDDERLKNERAKALKAKERFAQNAMGISSTGQTSGGSQLGSPTLSGGAGGYSDPYGGAIAIGQDFDSSPSEGGRRMSTDVALARPSSLGEEEIQLQLALAMSKEEHDEEVRKQKSDDIKLQLAIDESKKQHDDERKKQQPPTANNTILNMSGGVADPWGVPAQNSQPADPWGAPKPQPTNQNVDAWGSPARVKPPTSSDPWGVSSPAPVVNQSSPAPQIDPWGLPPQATANQSGNFDAFGTPNAKTNAPTTNGTNNIDDAFDLLSARSNENSPAKSNAQTENNSKDLWDLTGMNSSIDQATTNARKTPQDFLGANAALVNLDELVAKNPPKGNNPFASSGQMNNPFEGSAPRVPMNQLQNTTPGFTSVNPGLPTPLLPYNNTTQPPIQQQGYNPFL
ncbi:hypothetical protein SNE40_018913 [Patella caerulea]|uniref:ENTH domain-containing protein n=1 Tax=Patella caerulea TaxID=87958 RepID=A0AAN8J7I0_PATCE